VQDWRVIDEHRTTGLDDLAGDADVPREQPSVRATGAIHSDAVLTFAVNAKRRDPVRNPADTDSVSTDRVPLRVADHAVAIRDTIAR
jgi:hypothetical protein